MYINKVDKIKKNKIFNTDITPTFVMYKNNVEIGRISGYSNPEMFWWQVDEIIENWFFLFTIIKFYVYLRGYIEFNYL